MKFGRALSTFNDMQTYSFRFQVISYFHLFVCLFVRTYRSNISVNRITKAIQFLHIVGSSIGQISICDDGGIMMVVYDVAIALLVYG